MTFQYFGESEPLKNTPKLDLSLGLHLPRTPSPGRLDSAAMDLDGNYQSPFSDYYTDPSYSADREKSRHGDERLSSALNSPSPLPTQSQRKLLRRLNSIGAQILRKETTIDAVHTVLDRLDELEAAVAAVDSQSRMPADAMDSALFMPDDDESADSVSDDQVPAYQSPHAASSPEEETLLAKAPEDDAMGNFDDAPGSSAPESMSGLGYAELKSEVSTEDREDQEDRSKFNDEELGYIDRIVASSAKLKQRLEDVKHTNRIFLDILQEEKTKSLTLHSENEVLRSKLNFTQTDLIFLKLQVQSLEAQVAPFFGKVANTKEGQELIRGFEQWESEFSRIDREFKANREPLSKMRRSSLGDSAIVLEADDSLADLQSVTTRSDNRTATSERYASPIRPESHRACSSPAQVDASFIKHTKIPRDTQALDSASTVAQAIPPVEATDAVALQEEEHPLKVDEPKPKSPWKELWDSLTSFAGTDLYDDDDSDSQS